MLVYLVYLSLQTGFFPLDMENYWIGPITSITFPPQMPENCQWLLVKLINIYHSLIFLIFLDVLGKWQTSFNLKAEASSSYKCLSITK